MPRQAPVARPWDSMKSLKFFEELSRTAAARRTPDMLRRLDDAAYTLCVSTGTRSVHAALLAARHQIQDTPPGTGSTRAG
ncbi:DUF5133 domain-containing protein [Streptomyces uncialis]|uniref:DUF5133 domain-containing protein n=1 Tax=Streptomyces uncialis TaxID=1048205 RepID=UPI00380E169B